MQKPRCLMHENSVSSKMFLILLSFITLGSVAKINFFVQSTSKIYSDVLGIFFFGGGRKHAQKPVKKSFIRHFARFSFLGLSLTFILKSVVTYLACSEKIGRLASKIA